MKVIIECEYDYTLDGTIDADAAVSDELYIRNQINAIRGLAVRDIFFKKKDTQKDEQQLILENTDTDFEGIVKTITDETKREEGLIKITPNKPVTWKGSSNDYRFYDDPNGMPSL